MRGMLLNLGVVAAVAGLAVQVHGAVLAQYSFDANTSSSDVDALSSASTFTAGSQGVRSSTANSFVQTYADIASSTEAQAIANNDYFTFTLTPNSGHAASLNSLTFSTQVHFNTGLSDSLGGTFFVRSNVDAYASNLASFATPPTTIGDSAVGRNVSLSAAAFQNLAGAVTFRIYTYKDTTSTTNSDGMRVDNVTLNGTLAAVPEPGTLVLGSVTAAGLLLARRGRASA